MNGDDGLSPQTPAEPSTSKVWLPALAALLLLTSFHVLVVYRQGSDPTSVGFDIIQFSRGQGRLFGAYLLFGGAATVTLALAFTRYLQRGDRLVRSLAQATQGSDRSFVLLASFWALFVAVLGRTLVLQSTALVDDEGVYRFAAQILAKGHLYLPGNPDPAFFEHNFVVNGDKVFTQYFLGWPALMLPYLLLGIEGYANAFYFALSMPPLFLILRQLCGSGWARLGLVLALVSPILSISAATLLSHSSCMMALSYFFWCALRSFDRDAHWRWHAGAAVAFSVAFFIRPLSTLGIGLPWLLFWLWSLKGHPRAFRMFSAFAIPSLVFALLFFGANQAMNGHPLKSAYASFQDHHHGDVEVPLLKREIAFVSPGHSLTIAAAAFQRLNFAALGWPVSWLFVFLAGRGRAPKLWLASIGTYFAANFFTTAVGVDGYGPMHYLEAVLPILLLTVLGLERTTELAGRLGMRPLPVAMALCSTLVAVVAYFPYQALTLHRMTTLELAARTTPDDLRKPAVVFVIPPWEAPSCGLEDSKSWVHSWPMYDPDLQNEVLWLAHVDPEKNRELARRRFPDRAAYITRWMADCRRVFLPLEALPPADNAPLRP